MTINKLIVTSILVGNQDEALKFYTEKLGFEKRQDLAIPTTTERWLTVSPKNQKEIQFLLRKPRAGENELIIKEVQAKIGKGSLWTFSTNNCQETYEMLASLGVEFIYPPYKSLLGMEAIFADPFGNRFTLLEIPKS
ncbi:MAG: VOC family protein [Candidatus Heimdallarchaeota archaeon]|nr:VOC family protein [Candidatus Heimdallarchaeota archaeon]